MKKIAELLDDLTFKFLWKNDKSRKWLKNIIGEIINLDISDYELYYNEDSEGPKLHEYNLDILLKKDNILIIIELNKYITDTIFIKNRSYQYRKAGNQFFNGEKYHDYTVILVNLNNMNNDIGIEKYEQYDKRNNKYITHLIEYDVYLEYYKKRCYNYLEKSLSIFNYETNYNMMRKIADNESELLEVIKILEVLNMDEIYIEIAEKLKADDKLRRTEKAEAYDEGVTKGISEGIREGISQGISQGKIEQNELIARNMLKLEYNIEEISNITGLSKQEIMKLN